MLRIVAVADTHLFTDDYAVPDGDVFVHAGDLCRGGKLTELDAALRWIRRLPHRTKIVVAGNHDYAFERKPKEARELVGDELTYLQDDLVFTRGLRVYGSPWQPEFCQWAFNLPRGEQLAEVWGRIPSNLDLLVTHGPPAGLGDRNSYGDARAGCEDLRARVAVVRPKLHLFGHIHEDGGAWERDGTWFVNCTSWECERAPTVIDYDEVTHTVLRVEAPPSGRKEASDAPMDPIEAAARAAAAKPSQ